MNDIRVTSSATRISIPGGSLFEPFPAARAYHALLTPPSGSVRDAPLPEPESFSERHLQCIWADESLRPAPLRCATGETVSVEHPGRWNLEPGPDFLDAALQVGPDKRRLKGDIEIHIRPSDWLHHGHQDDPRYARVIAHVCYLEDRLPANALPAGAVRIGLKSLLRARPSFDFESIDLTAYPYAALHAHQPPCAQVLQRLPAERWEALLEAAGAERLRRKAVRLRDRLHESGAEQCLYEEVMGALGYKHNQGAFRRLARRLPLAALREDAAASAEQTYTLMLGVAGLLPQTETGHDPDTRAFLRRLWDTWWKKQANWHSEALSPHDWHTGGQRPQNQPVRRLAAAAALFTPTTPLADRLTTVDPSDDNWFQHAATVLEPRTEIPYWTHRLTLSGKQTARPTALIGTRRTAAVLSNVIIPFLAATGIDTTDLLRRIPAEQDNALLRQTAHALFGRDHNPTLYHSGIRQQGLLQIFHDFCINARTGCPECPLVPALTAETVDEPV